MRSGYVAGQKNGTTLRMRRSIGLFIFTQALHSRELFLVSGFGFSRASGVVSGDASHPLCFFFLSFSFAVNRLPNDVQTQRAGDSAWPISCNHPPRNFPDLISPRAMATTRGKGISIAIDVRVLTSLGVPSLIMLICSLERWHIHRLRGESGDRTPGR